MSDGRLQLNGMAVQTTDGPIDVPFHYWTYVKLFDSYRKYAIDLDGNSFEIELAEGQ